jgi:sialate O-acetylesterase
VWGEAAPGAEIAVSFRGKAYHARADSGGAWRLFLDSQVPGGPYAMEISAGEGGPLLLEDLYVGDVWICSGQSNMEMPMERLKDEFPQEWEPPVNALIRQFKVPQEWEFSGPRQELSGGCWTAASAETLHDFSGTAWFFARSLFDQHKTPVGLINASWGGTPAEAWMSRDALAAFPEKIALGDQYADPALRDEIARANEAQVKAWEAKLATADAGLAAAWHKPETDVSQWGEITLPGDFAEAGLAGFCGVIWLCREFEVSGEFAAGESRLWLGTIVDADTVYVNGVEVGTTTYRYPPRKYPIPAGLLHEGKNRIVIRVTCCNSGCGGVTRDKDFRFFSANGRIELGGVWKYRAGAGANPRPAEFFTQRLPMCLYNAMIAPLLGYSCKGVIWYQGESNDGNCHEYAALFSALINDWRDKKRTFQPEPHDLPFLFVQLPIFGEAGENNEADSWAIIRDAQRSALSLPATGMAAGLDLGEWNDLHPLNKKDIGRRLALAAERVVFNNPNTAPGPLLRVIERRDSRLFLTFDNCGKGLTAREEPHVGVIAGGKTHRLPAVIESADCLSVDISTLPNAEKLLYAWTNNPRDRQLFNSDNLPAIPFRTAIPEAGIA